MSLETERLRARYQGDLHNLGIVAERRHDVCRELFRLVYVADGAVGSLYGAREMPAFEQYSRDEVHEYMEQRRFPATAKDTVLEVWDTERERAVRKLQTAHRVVDVGLGSESYREAWNYFLTNSLYLPDPVTDLVERIFNTLWEILGAAKLPRGTYRGRDITELKKQASELIWQLRGDLQSVLGVTTEDRLLPEGSQRESGE